MFHIQSIRGFASAMSRKLRRHGLCSRRTGAPLGHGFTIDGCSRFCLGVDIRIFAYTEAEAREVIDDITTLFTDWGNPHKVTGGVEDEVAECGYYTACIHVESTRGGFPSCVGADAG